MSFMDRSKQLINNREASTASAGIPKPTALPSRPPIKPGTPPAPPRKPGSIGVPGALPRPAGMPPVPPRKPGEIVKPKVEIPKVDETNAEINTEAKAEVKAEVKTEETTKKATTGLLSNNPLALMKAKKEREKRKEEEAKAEKPVNEEVKAEEPSTDSNEKEAEKPVEPKTEAKEEVKSEAKEEVKTEEKEEVKEKVKEEKPKAKKATRSVRKKKAETTEEASTEASTEKASIAPQPMVDINTRTDIDFDQAIRAIKSGFVDTNWEEFRLDVSQRLKDIVITNDMNTTALKSVLAELNELKTEIWDKYSDTKSQYESLVSKEPAGLIERVRIANSIGSNAETRKANGIMAAANYKDANGNTINLFELLDEIRERYNFLKELMDIISYKSRLLVTMLGGLKLEK